MSEATRTASSSSSIGPEIPSYAPQHKYQHQASSSSRPDADADDGGGGTNDAGGGNEEDEDEDDYTPALPPDMIPSSKKPSSPPPPTSKVKKRVLGPTLPPSHPSSSSHYPSHAASSAASYGASYAAAYDDSDSDSDIGPKPPPTNELEGKEEREEDGVRKFLEIESRRRQNLEDEANNKGKGALKREEWMVVPPSSGDLFASLDPKKLSKPRQFLSSTPSSHSAPSKGVSSLWTETPAEKLQRLKDEVSGSKRPAHVSASAGDTEEEAARKRRRKEVDEEIRRGVEEYRVRNRGGALVDAYQGNGGKGEAEGKGKGGKGEEEGIWEHGRDMAISGRLLGDREREKMIRDARGLGDRFGSGSGGGFM